MERSWRASWENSSTRQSRPLFNKLVFQHRQEWDLRVLPEIRSRSEKRVRIADVYFVSRSQPVEQVSTQPPLAVIEISLEDRIS
jgi:hypothetical protein